jgi:hypothetical protein
MRHQSSSFRGVDNGESVRCRASAQTVIDGEHDGRRQLSGARPLRQKMRERE